MCLILYKNDKTLTKIFTPACSTQAAEYRIY